MTSTKSQPAADIGTTLGTFALFSGLAPVVLARLAAISGRATWQAGAYLFHRGDPGNQMLALTSGRVRLSLGSAQGRELVLRHSVAGDVLGELALMDGEPRSADALVLEPVQAVVIPRAGFLAVAEEMPTLGLALARYLSGLIRATNYQMESIAIYDLQMRIVRFFLMALQQAHGPDLPDQARLRNGLTQADLSAIVGATRPKVNRVLQVLMAEGALVREGSHWLCNVPRLHEIAATAEADWSG